jgi:hypothetical protein
MLIGYAIIASAGMIVAVRLWGEMTPGEKTEHTLWFTFQKPISNIEYNMYMASDFDAVVRVRNALSSLLRHGEPCKMRFDIFIPLQLCGTSRI